jgi:hypothetical protein
MSRITRFGIQALASLALALSAAPLVRPAEPTRYEYAYCMGIAGNPRVEVISPVYKRLPEGVYEDGPSSFTNTVRRKFGTGVREAGCIYAPTAAEAEAKRKELIDGVTKALGPQGVMRYLAEAESDRALTPLQATSPATGLGTALRYLRRLPHRGCDDLGCG